MIGRGFPLGSGLGIGLQGNIEVAIVGVGFEVRVRLGVIVKVPEAVPIPQGALLTLQSELPRVIRGRRLPCLRLALLVDAIDEARPSSVGIMLVEHFPRAVSVSLVDNLDDLVNGFHDFDVAPECRRTLTYLPVGAPICG